MRSDQTVNLAVFDCDGTLVDSQFAIHACMHQAFSSQGLESPDIRETRRVVGLPLKVAIEVLLGSAHGSVEALSAGYSDAWQAMRRTGDLNEPLFDGMRDVIDGMHANGWTLGVATGKSSRGLDATLSHHGIERYFATLQTADRARGKPDPEMLEIAMIETGATADATIMIGDTTFDMEMSVAAGVRGIGVTWGYHEEAELRAAGASAIVHTVDELRETISDLSRSDEHG